MNIDTAYEFVKDLANKDQRGFIPSAKFNRYAERAQMEVFMQRYGNPKEYQPGRPIPRIAYDMTQKIHDDLRPFLKPWILSIDRNGQAPYPADYVHPSAIRYVVYSGDSSYETPVEVIPDDKAGYRLSSTVVPPSRQYPICVLYDQHIQFYPASLGSVKFSYLRQPRIPKWGFTIVNSREVYDAGSSVDFEFPDEVHNEICIKILSYVGIKMREPELVQYAEGKDRQGI